MPLAVTLDPEWIEIRLTGLSSVSAARRTVRVPWSAVRSVRTEPFSQLGRRRTLPRPLGGTLVRTLKVDGRRYLLCYREGDPTLTLDLDRERVPTLRFDVIVMGVGPETTVVAPTRAGRTARVA
jgi:hypothetical protein